MRLDQKDDDIGIGGPAPCGGDHGAVKAAAGAEEAGCIDENDLRLAFHADTPDAGAGRLHLVGDDGDLGPDHPVQQGGFPGIGFADQGDEAGAGFGVSHRVSPSGRAAPALPPVLRPVSRWPGP